MPILNTLSPVSARAYRLSGATGEVDPHFSSTTILLHANQFGTSTKNDVVLDSSIYGNSVVKSSIGTSGQSSVSPYSNGYSTGSWSALLIGSTTNAFAFSSSAGFLFGTGDFTVEFWINSLSGGSPTTAFPTILDFRSTDTTTTQFALAVNSASQLLSYGLPSGTGITVIGQLRRGRWDHVAIVKNGANFIVYINGILSVTLAAGATNYTDQILKIGNSTVNAVAAGGYSYLSNLRVTKGQVLYTGTFTPSTIPLTISTNGNASGNVVSPISTNVSLLTLQNFTVKDNSLNSITISGTSPQRGRMSQFNPFAPLEPYSPIRHGGSYSGPSLIVNPNGNFALGTGDFTIEFWHLPNSISVANYDLLSWESTGGPRINFSCGSTAIIYGLGSATADVKSVASAYSWHHVAFVRSNSVVNLYVNGKLLSSAASTADYIRVQPTIIPSALASISDFRIVKGTAVYTSDFSPPTAPLEAIPNTVLLLRFNNAGIYDSARLANFMFPASDLPVVDTTQKLFGSGSLKFSRSSTRNFLALSNRYASSSFGSMYSLGEEFTIEMWVRKLTSGALQHLYGDTSSTGVSLLLLANDTIQFNIGSISGLVSLTTSATIQNLQWTHIAVTRQTGFLLKIWINGVMSASATQTTNFNYPSLLNNLLIGNESGTPLDYQFDGNIDEIRVSNVCRYTTDFTPSGPFPNQ
jgi:hypothetical protein